MTSSFESTPFVQDANASAQSRQELQAKLNGLGGLNGRKLSPEAREKKLREACEGFESIFIQKMWQEMRNTVPKGGLLQGNEERFWQDMYDQELAKSMTHAGGIGLADMMYEQLSRNLVSASRGTVSQSMGGAFTPDAAPLVQMQVADPQVEKDTPVKSVAAIYEGEAPQMAEAADLEQVDRESLIAPVVQAAASMVNSAPVAHEAKAEKTQTVSHVKKAKSVKAHVPGEASGLQLAYLARRDAGDKLGANAIRPALRARKQNNGQHSTQEAVEMTAPNTVSQTGNVNPGSAEGLRAALSQAKNGVTTIDGAQSPQLHNIVAQVQAQNAMNAMQPNLSTPGQATQAVEASQPAEPVTRKVRYTTNIPGKNKNSRKNDTIRLLNVENTGVNSRQGQGLAAYHAAQEAARAESSVQPLQTQPVAGTAANDGAPTQTPIAPLTASSVKKNTDEANFAIPPLKASDMRG